MDLLQFGRHFGIQPSPISSTRCKPSSWFHTNQRPILSVSVQPPQIRGYTKSKAAILLGCCLMSLKRYFPTIRVLSRISHAIRLPEAFFSVRGVKKDFNAEMSDILITGTDLRISVRLEVRVSCLEADWCLASLYRPSSSSEALYERQVTRSRASLAAFLIGFSVAPSLRSSQIESKFSFVFADRHEHKNEKSWELFVADPQNSSVVFALDTVPRPVSSPGFNGRHSLISISLASFCWIHETTRFPYHALFPAWTCIRQHRKSHFRRPSCTSRTSRIPPCTSNSNTFQPRCA